MRTYIYILTFLLSLSAQWSWAQAPFSVGLSALEIDQLPGVQSYAFGQHNGKWLIVGGRIDGLHIRQPHSSFLASENNSNLIVIDPVALVYWSASNASLPAAIREQLSSTNMSFEQVGDYLYCIGGYGYSATLGDHITHDKLTAIHVANTINAVINGQTLASHFRQLSHSDLAVAGGRLQRIDTTYHLLGGQRFTGRYNPMGPDHGPGFVQEYTNAIRRFTLSDNGTNIQLNMLSSYVDTAALHRRDYNAEPQIMPDGSEGITMFSGVFKDPVDLPYLNCVNVNASGYTVNDSFSQYYNHYHCATAPVFCRSTKEMHNLFFGGIAQYYDLDGQLVQDDDVPFVSTIARVSRDSNGLMQEYRMNTEMPAYLGAGSEFIPVPGIPHFANGVLDWDSMQGDSVHIGYIYGGIESSAPNIFFINTGVESEASSRVFKVYLIRNNGLGVDRLNPASDQGYGLQVYPNPNTGDFVFQIKLLEDEVLNISVTDIQGKALYNNKLDGRRGLNQQQVEIDVPQNVYLLRVEGKHRHQTLKVVMH